MTENFDEMHKYYRDHFQERLQTFVLEYMNAKDIGPEDLVQIADEHQIKKPMIDAMNGRFLGGTGELISICLLINKQPLFLG